MLAKRETRNGSGRNGARRGKAWRLFDYGEFRHVVLTLLAEQPRHGYDIIRAVDQRTGGAYCPSPGVVYPTLSLLDDGGYVRVVAGGGARNRYAITSAGRAFLRDNKCQVDAILSRLQHRGATPAGASPAIVAAMDNLKAALRSGARPWSASEARSVAAAIEAAARHIRGLRKPIEPLVRIRQHKVQ